MAGRNELIDLLMGAKETAGKIDRYFNEPKKKQPKKKPKRRRYTGGKTPAQLALEEEQERIRYREEKAKAKKAGKVWPIRDEDEMEPVGAKLVFNRKTPKTKSSYWVELFRRAYRAKKGK